jgi:hypothetical protein
MPKVRSEESYFPKPWRTVSPNRRSTVGFKGKLVSKPCTYEFQVSHIEGTYLRDKKSWGRATPAHNGTSIQYPLVVAVQKDDKVVNSDDDVEKKLRKAEENSRKMAACSQHGVWVVAAWVKLQEDEEGFVSTQEG